MDGYDGQLKTPAGNIWIEISLAVGVVAAIIILALL
jgi:hypothetical protein